MDGEAAGGGNEPELPRRPLKRSEIDSTVSYSRLTFLRTAGGRGDRLGVGDGSGCRSRRRSCRGRSRRRRFHRLSLHDVDAALEISAVLDDDARGPDVAHQPAVLADFEAVAGFNVTLDRAKHHDLARLHGCVYFSVRPDGELIIVQLNRAFDVAVHVQVFLAVDLTVDLNGLAYAG